MDVCITVICRSLNEVTVPPKSCGFGTGGGGCAGNAILHRSKAARDRASRSRIIESELNPIVPV